jgi:hypothetical protein
VRKLTDSDKQEILKLYRETAETTSTLAERYDVSNSTISRLLKSTLPEDEYEYLVSLKRAARTPEGRAQVSYDNRPVFSQAEPPLEAKAVEISVPQKKVQIQKPIVVEQHQEEPSPDDGKDSDSTSVIRRVKRRSSATPQPVRHVGEQLELFEQQQQLPPPKIKNIPSPQFIEDTHANANVIAQMLGEDLLDESEALEDLEDLDEDEDYLDEDEDEFEITPPIVTRPRPGDALVRVLPLSAASLPKTCYLVIDRSSELITRPLRDFGDLGQIPNLETQQKTLPVFDNHRVAKRFSTKRDRVIKVPDSKMLHKARYHLQAKGITRLLIDGQVYSLSSSAQ